MTADFEPAKTRFLEGIQHFEADRLAEAEAAFSASLAALPGRPSTLTNLAATRLRLGRHAEALPLLEEATAAEPDNVEAWCHRAVALGELGRLDEALASDAKALALDPACVPALRHRGLALQRLGRHGDALAAFTDWTRQQPGHAPAWLHQGEALLAQDRQGEALAAFDRCLAIDSDVAHAWSRRGAILKQLGQAEDAADAFERAITLGADAELNGFLLASVTGRKAPAAAPRGYVESLFDNYAPDFDAHLVDVLRYQGHTHLVEQLAAQIPAPVGSILDLGCGTGLCAPLLRPMTRALHGVDVSAAMVESARARGLYDAVTQADLAEHLASTDERHDVLAAADVFIYLGDLAPVFAGARRVLRSGGLLAFTVEKGEAGSTYALAPSLTYRHGDDYLRTLADAHGFEVLSLTEAPIREDQTRPIPGWYAVLRTLG